MREGEGEEVRREEIEGGGGQGREETQKAREEKRIVVLEIWKVILIYTSKCYLD